MAKSPSYELKREMDSIAIERKEIIKALADVRKKIFAIINRECECIVYCGEEISPTAAAKFVVENMDKLCNIVLNYIELNKKRSVCAGYWNELLGEYGVPEFFKLNESEPEQIARKWISDIQKYLDWYAESYQPLLENLVEIGIDPKVLFMDSAFDSAFQKTNKILYAVENVIPAICDVLEESLYVSRCCCTIGKIKKELC